MDKTIQIDTFSRFTQVSRETITSLKKYEDILVKANKTLNLIGNSTIKDIWTRHFLDSVQVIDFIDENDKTLVDLGSGAGFPGLVLAIAFKDRKIPLKVKSFVNPKDKGTTVGKGNGIEPKVPCFIVKKNQVLLKLSSLDFSFIVEDNISEIFKLFSDHRLKVDLIQNSAISFSVCLDNKFRGLQPLLEELKRKFKVVCHEDVSLYTIRHFNDDSVKSLQNGKSVLVEQRGKETVQLVVK